MPRFLYPVVIHKDANTDFGLSAVDFPATCGGETPEEALQLGEDLLREVVQDYLSDGRALPEPTAIAAIPPDLLEGAVLVSLVPVTIPGPAKRISVTMDPDLIDAIDRVTTNRSAFLASAARRELDIIKAA